MMKKILYVIIATLISAFVGLFVLPQQVETIRWQGVDTTEDLLWSQVSDLSQWNSWQPWESDGDTVQWNGGTVLLSSVDPEKRTVEFLVVDSDQIQEKTEVLGRLSSDLRERRQAVRLLEEELETVKSGALEIELRNELKSLSPEELEELPDEMKTVLANPAKEDLSVLKDSWSAKRQELALLKSSLLEVHAEVESLSDRRGRMTVTKELDEVWVSCYYSYQSGYAPWSRLVAWIDRGSLALEIDGGLQKIKQNLESK